LSRRKQEISEKPEISVISHVGFVTLERWKLPNVTLPLDGGGLRWGWTWYGSPHPPPLLSEPEALPGRRPPEERGIIGLFSEDSVLNLFNQRS